MILHNFIRRNNGSDEEFDAFDENYEYEDSVERKMRLALALSHGKNLMLKVRYKWNKSESPLKYVSCMCLIFLIF